MKLTRERRILLTIVILGAAALVVDRLTGPSNATATVQFELPLETTSSPVVAATGEMQAAKPSSLAQRLWATIGETTLQSPFLVPSSWSTSTEPVREGSLPPADAITPFVAAHHLSGIMIASSRSSAIIDGRPITIGDFLDGFQLVDVDFQTATLIRGKARATLRLRAPVLSDDSRDIRP